MNSLFSTRTSLTEFVRKMHKLAEGSSQRTSSTTAPAGDGFWNLPSKKISDCSDISSVFTWLWMQCVGRGQEKPCRRRAEPA